MRHGIIFLLEVFIYIISWENYNVTYRNVLLKKYSYEIKHFIWCKHYYNNNKMIAGGTMFFVLLGYFHFISTIKIYHWFWLSIHEEMIMTFRLYHLNHMKSSIPPWGISSSKTSLVFALFTLSGGKVTLDIRMFFAMVFWTNIPLQWGLSFGVSNSILTNGG